MGDKKSDAGGAKVLTPTVGAKALPLKPTTYQELNSRQRENFNFQKISGVLADYGFTTILLSDDWNGADFIAIHCDGTTTLKIQLKSRLCFDKRYLGKDLLMCFRDGNDWYLFPHDEVLAIALAEDTMGKSKSWDRKGKYSMPGLSRKNRARLARYRLDNRQ